MQNTKFEKRNPETVRFGLISDCHVPNNVYKQYFALALDSFGEIGGLDGLLMTGDIIYQDGAEIIEERYDPVNELLAEKMNGVPIVYTIGNHETPLTNSTSEKIAYAREVFERKAGQKVRYSTKIAGFHFITDITVEAPDVEWIEKCIEQAAAEDSDKPIFLMLHDCFTKLLTHSYPNVREWELRLAEILKKYPQTVVLVGHLHMAAQNPDIAVQDGFTVVQVPGLGETGFILGDGLFGDFEIRIKPQAMLMEIENNVVYIYKLNLESKTYIGEPIVIDIAEVKNGREPYSIANKSASNIPYFDKNAEISVEISGDTAEISFPKAYNKRVNESVDDGFVIAYRAEVFGSRGNSVFSQNVISDYFRADSTGGIAERYCFKVQGLAVPGEYTVSVVPISPFRKEGAPLTARFSVK